MLSIILINLVINWQSVKDKALSYAGLRDLGLRFRLRALEILWGLVV